tara:strand:+ start:90 stop:521 length:432 start_codon:yes stop_codon:yes gene_type:complete
MVLFLEGFLVNDIEDWDEKIPFAEAVPLSEYDLLQDKEVWPDVKIYGNDFRNELIDMYNAVTRLNLWEWFKNDEPPKCAGYMFWNVYVENMDTGKFEVITHPNITKISKNVTSKYGGCSFSFAMNCMQKIAKTGFDNWKLEQR